MNLPFIDDTAKGKISLSQSRWLLEQYDAGLRGNLTHPRQPDRTIKGDLFARAFKMLIIHHYLFNPPGQRGDYTMRVRQRKEVFKNIALADLDIMLCGHKHYVDFKPMEYGEHLDKRAVNRYLFNYFRRIIGLNSLPLQFEDGRGGKFSQPFSMLLSVLTLGVMKNSNQSKETIVAEVLQLLREGIATPALLIEVSAQFATERAWTSSDGVNSEEVQEIVRHITHSIKMEDRKRLSEVANKVVEVSKNLRKRPFVQSMSGSSAKNSNLSSQRSFNIYDLHATDKHWKLVARRFNWDWEEKAFVPDASSHNVNFPREL